MNFLEDLGSGFHSLSINDPHLRLAEHDIDDAMDIDFTNEFGYIDKLSAHEGSEDDDVDVEEVDDSNTGKDAEIEKGENASSFENDSFLGILSPTALGARFALLPQKLLMAPPTTESQSSRRNSSVDYEFDTSDISKSQLVKTSFAQTNSSNFILEPSQDIFQTKSKDQDYTSGYMAPASNSQSSRSNLNYLSGSLPFSSGMFAQSNLGFPPVNPHSQHQTIIHHHHYYVNDHNSVSPVSSSELAASLSFMTLLKQNTKLPHQLADLQRSDHTGQSPSNQLVSYEKWAKNEQLVPFTGAHLTPHLPSPWDTRAVPAERMPYVILSYLQLITNTLLSVFALHILVAMVQAIRSDVSHKMALEANNLLIEIALCRRAYSENNCDPSQRVPALEQMCEYYEKCMLQDPSQVGNRSRIGAHTLGVILNSLIEPLGLKFLGVGSFFVVLIFACNFGFGYIRARAYYGMTLQRQTATSN